MTDPTLTPGELATVAFCVGALLTLLLCALASARMHNRDLDRIRRLGDHIRDLTFSLRVAGYRLEDAGQHAPALRAYLVADDIDRLLDSRAASDPRNESIS